MPNKPMYSGSLTREQFLFFENRQVAKMMLQNKSYDEILKEVTEDNIFQYPSTVSYGKIVSACYKRLSFVEDDRIVEIVAHGSAFAAKQALMYCLMSQNLVVRDFMIDVVGEKYRTGVLDFDKTDINHFFLSLATKVDSVAAWSDSTLKRIKSMIIKSMTEVGYLTTIKSEKLNPITADTELVDIIKERGEYEFLQAFNEV